MKTYIWICATVFLAGGAMAVDQPPDNRIKPGINVGEPFPEDVPDKFLAEAALIEKIASLHDAKLSEVMEKRLLGLRWQKRVALRDADYFLCVFDSNVRSEPGENPRVLILFTPNYELKTWGRFTQEPHFVAGCIVNRRNQPQTYFVTINQSGRFDNGISFEKYTIAADGIRRLGWDMELGRIPEEP